MHCHLPGCPARDKLAWWWLVSCSWWKYQWWYVFPSSPGIPFAVAEVSIVRNRCFPGSSVVPLMPQPSLTEACSLDWDMIWVKLVSIAMAATSALLASWSKTEWTNILLVGFGGVCLIPPGQLAWNTSDPSVYLKSKEKLGGQNPVIAKVLL